MTEYRRTADRALADYRHAKRRATEEKESLHKAFRSVKSLTKAQQIVQLVAQAVQQAAHDKIAEVVSRCLAAVYEDPYTFQIFFDRKRGKTEARMRFCRDGHEYDPKEGVGGGVLDVAALALRLITLVLQKPKRRKLLVLDEPFKNINGTENRERAALLLTSLAKEFKVQIIITTGYDWLKIGKVIKL